MTAWIIGAFCLFLCFFSYLIDLHVIRIFYKVPLLKNISSTLLSQWPKLSVVIAARDEEDTLGPALDMLLKQDYPNLEIILVDDRSTDKTSEIIDNIASHDRRVKTIHISDLPKGWLGKVHALDEGTKQATGEWMLYTDADVRMHQGLLKKTIAYVTHQNLDHLSLMPTPQVASFWLDVAIYTFGMYFLVGMKAHQCDAIGIGAFNLVKRFTLNRTEGIRWLKMEVADDVGLGILINKTGAKSAFIIAHEEISLAWYLSLKGMFQGLEKNMFGTIARYSYLRMTGIIMLIWAFVSAPLLCIIFFPHLRAFGILAYLLMLICGFIGNKIFQKPILPAIFTPVGHIFFSLMLLRSGFMCFLNHGIKWRGTFYSISELKKSQRVKL
ncbi:MAG: glycosyltransferase family 2 protein [Chlamydiota bacterium]|nr:glycosyltransferase family 2 protein [Chlamydiota bacterium]